MGDVRSCKPLKRRKRVTRLPVDACGLCSERAGLEASITGDIEEVLLMSDSGEVLEGTQTNFFVLQVRQPCVSVFAPCLGIVLSL